MIVMQTESLLLNRPPTEADNRSARLAAAFAMKHGKTITLKTLDTLCFILNCGVSEIIEYIPDE